MRINLYSQELTDQVEVVANQADDGLGPYGPVFYAARLKLHSPAQLHPDDQSGITFWLPKSAERREQMAKAFEEIARIYRESPAG